MTYSHPTTIFSTKNDFQIIRKPYQPVSIKRTGTAFLVFCIITHPCEYFCFHFLPEPFPWNILPPSRNGKSPATWSAIRSHAAVPRCPDPSAEFSVMRLHLQALRFCRMPLCTPAVFDASQIKWLQRRSNPVFTFIIPRGQKNETVVKIFFMQTKECGLVFEENGRLFINIEEKKKEKRKNQRKDKVKENNI